MEKDKVKKVNCEAREVILGCCEAREGALGLYITIGGVS